VEELHLAPELAVVALGRLLQHRQMRLEVVAGANATPVMRWSCGRLTSPNQ
jgi:hypothetical protein